MTGNKNSFVQIVKTSLNKLIRWKVLVILPYVLLLGITIDRLAGTETVQPVSGQIQITRRPAHSLIPEYQKTDGVILSEMLFQDQLGGLSLTRAVLAGRAQPVILTNEPKAQTENKKWLLAQGFSTEEAEKIMVLGISHDTYWLRDFGPIPVAQGGPGKNTVLKLVDPIYRNDSLLNDTVPYQLGLYLRASVEHMPVYMDGGNFLTDSKRCYIAEGSKESLTVYEDRIDHFLITPPDQLKEHLKHTLGCQEVVSFADAPHEHIDMWAKVIDDQRVVVNSIPENALSLVRKENPDEYQRLLAINRNLDAAAKQFADYLEVVRIPMPIPFGKIFRTYTNATIVNNVIAVPSYKKFIDMDKDYPDQTLLTTYEADVRKIYESLGFEVHFVESDQLIQHGGSVHCATSHIPRIANERVAASKEGGSTPPVTESR